MIELRLFRSIKTTHETPREDFQGVDALEDSLSDGLTVEKDQRPDPNKRCRGLAGRFLTGFLGLLLLYVGVDYALPAVTVIFKEWADNPVVSEALNLTNGQSTSQSYEILDSSGGTYFGPTEALSYVGKGEFAYKDSGVYDGEFRNSKRDGKGTFTWKNGDVYTGDWSSDDMVNGTYTFSDGRQYTGTFEKGAFGDGTFVVPEGYGGSKIKHLEATIMEGSIQSVHLVAYDGSQYKGKLNGSAEITYSSGSTYSGMAKNGRRDGVGEYKWIENGVIQAYYEGEWVNDGMSGSGTYHYTSELYPAIQGKFFNGKPEGMATYYKESGNTFETVWRNGSCVSVTET